MAETKTMQKGMRFSQDIINELNSLCLDDRRSGQNMVEVLIHNEYVKRHPPVVEGLQVKDRGCEAGN